MANFTHAIMIVVTITALAAVLHFNQNRAEDSARGGPRRGRLRSDLFAVLISNKAPQAMDSAALTA
jgi:hypothetical protein